MILPRHPDPRPRDLGPTLLRPGHVCVDASQPVIDVDATLALLDAVLQAQALDDVRPTMTPAWARWYQGKHGKN